MPLWWAQLPNAVAIRFLVRWRWPACSRLPPASPDTSSAFERGGFRFCRPKSLRRADRCSIEGGIIRERFKSVGSPIPIRSEEHTSELQSRGHLVCRLLLEKKKNP